MSGSENPSRRRRLAAALATTMLALIVAPTALAADCPRTSLADIEDEVMCPVCGTPLELATDAPQADRERAYIQRLVEACRSKDQIKRALVAEFGERVLALPGDVGDDDLGDVMAYLIPALGIVLAAAGIAFAVVRWRGRRGRPLAAGTTPAADGSRLERDMERYDL
jgi:cytochrome c-type biogenesis protein CcmH